MEFRNLSIYQIFCHQFKTFYFNNYTELFCKPDDYCFTQFLLSEDLGIICLSWGKDTYKVIDEKKWVLARVKYGI